MEELDRTKDIPTQVKDPELVDRRRRQITDAAVQLFIDKGFHKTASKEDILYMVCESIHAEVERGVSAAMSQAAGGRDALAKIIHEYFMVCHRMSDFILLIYQETQSLPSQWQKRVLENELRITGLFVEALAGIANSDDLIKLSENNLELAAHNIVILGHMWTFRRWYLGHHYSIEDYIQLQTDIILRMFAGGQKSF
jgi:AcrR family transcriptional regulator